MLSATAWREEEEEEEDEEEEEESFKAKQPTRWRRASILGCRPCASCPRTLVT
jgi:hypothetical protein